MLNELAIGVDIGGTNLKLGAVDKNGNLVEYNQVPIKRNSKGIVELKMIADSILEMKRRPSISDRVVAVGVSTPGVLDTEGKVVKFAVNLGWENVALVDFLQHHVELPIHMTSDTVAGSMGEYYFGSAQNKKRFLYVCMGTGIGGSLYLNGKYFTGEHGEAINIGHTSVVPEGVLCACGNMGCLEKYVSGPALVDRVSKERSQVDTLINEYVDKGSLLSVQLVYEAAMNGDAYARKVFSDAGRTLGVAMVNCTILFDVDCIVIGGGISQAGDLMFQAARQIIRERLGNEHFSFPRLIPAKHPTIGGILGAAVLGFQLVDGKHTFYHERKEEHVEGFLFSTD